MVIEAIVNYHHQFSQTNLQQYIVPIIKRQYEEGWKDDGWLLNNSAMVINFMMDRGFLPKDFTTTINKFIEVNWHIIIRAQLTMRIWRLRK